MAVTPGNCFEYDRVRFVKYILPDTTLIKSYRGTACTDSSDALVGDVEADVEAVFAEWRLLLKISAEVPELRFDFHFVESLIKNHGHFIIVTGPISLMHAMVVCGLRWNDKSGPSNFTLFVEDPLSSDNEKHRMFIEPPIRLALGTEKSAGPAPVARRNRRLRYRWTPACYGPGVTG